MLLLKPNHDPKNCDVCMDKDAMQAKFQDGFQGNLCWKCAQRMFKARTEEKKPKHNGKEDTSAQSETSGRAAVA